MADFNGKCMVNIHKVGLVKPVIHGVIVITPISRVKFHPVATHVLFGAHVSPRISGT